MADNRIKELFAREGQSAWQDDISRDMLNQGDIRKAIEEIGVRGLTSNPTIFEKAIASGVAYDEEIAGLLERDLDASAIFEAVAVRDIQDAALASSEEANLVALANRLKPGNGALRPANKLHER